MRIIAGERRGFRLITPSGKDTRPTLGRVRESIFSILGESIIDARVVDLYAGTGALGLEALSRGAQYCTFVEKSRGGVDALRKNITKLAYEKKSSILALDAIRGLTQELVADADVIFLDPPYAQDLGERTMARFAVFQLKPDATIIAQTGSRDKLQQEYGQFRLTRTQKYGDTFVHFFLSFAD